MRVIKAKAVELFYRHGFVGTDLRLIAEKVGLHPSSFYNYISNKNELLYLILRDGSVLAAEALDRALEDRTDPEDRLREAVRSYVALQAHQRYIAWTSITEVRMLTGKWRTEILRLSKEYESRWCDLVREGVDSGQFRQLDVSVTAYAILTMGQGVARWFNPRGRLTADQLGGIHADLVVAACVKTHAGGAAAPGSELSSPTLERPAGTDVGARKARSRRAG